MDSVLRKALLGGAVCFLLFGARALFGAQIAEMPFIPLSPSIMAQGGCAIATAQGYDAFFNNNPAGFSLANGAFTLASGSWIYSRPDLLVSQAFQLATGSTNPTATFDFINSQVTSGGFGAGSSIGIGYIRDGFALGMAFILDSLFHGPTMLGMTGNLTGTLGFIAGLSVPFEALAVRVHVDGDVRLMNLLHLTLRRRCRARSGPHRATGMVFLRILDSRFGRNRLLLQHKYARVGDQLSRPGDIPSGKLRCRSIRHPHGHRRWNRFSSRPGQLHVLRGPSFQFRFPQRRWGDR